MHRATGPVTGDERGAASVIVAIVLVVLMGCAALAVDVGAMYAEKAQLQNGLTPRPGYRRRLCKRSLRNSVGNWL